MIFHFYHVRSSSFSARGNVTKKNTMYVNKKKESLRTAGSDTEKNGSSEKFTVESIDANLERRGWTA